MGMLEHLTFINLLWGSVFSIFYFLNLNIARPDQSIHTSMEKYVWWFPQEFSNAEEKQIFGKEFLVSLVNCDLQFFKETLYFL